MEVTYRKYAWPSRRIDFEKAGRCLPNTIILNPFLTFIFEYEPLINAQEVATNIRPSCMKGQIEARLKANDVLSSTQYFVGPIWIPTAPIGTAMQAARTESHVTENNAMMYLLWL